MKKRRLKKSVINVLIVVLILYIGIMFFIINKKKPEKEITNYMISLIGKTEEEVKKYADFNKLRLNINYVYSDSSKGVSKQSIDEGNEIKENDTLNVTINKYIDKEQLKKDDINELGRIPVMMYHHIVNIDDNEYTGGNVDRDGYNRTSNAFRKDLEFYYQNGYRMVRLIDYVNGKIDVEYGKSPIVLTFDDGNADNIKVTGLDENGNIIIDPNSAVGILEEFKKKYPDFNVTATFFVTGYLFNQGEYNEKILKFLVDNGYDVGNHTKDHNDMTKTTEEETEYVVGYVYDKLDKIIKDKYVNIVALPFGTPYLSTHKNFEHIKKSNFNGKVYETVTTLRVGWEPDTSPFSKNFNKNFIKRCRAYDNNGKEFDIDMVFNSILKDLRYVSDGDPDTITVPSEYEKYLNDNNLYKILY